MSPTSISWRKFVRCCKLRSITCERRSPRCAHSVAKPVLEEVLTKAVMLFACYPGTHKYFPCRKITSVKLLSQSSNSDHRVKQACTATIMEVVLSREAVEWIRVETVELQLNGCLPIPTSKRICQIHGPAMKESSLDRDPNRATILRASQREILPARTRATMVKQTWLL